MSKEQNSISIYQKNKCLKVLDKITSYHISIMFRVPVDPERDQCPNYLEIIKRPMDLQTVRQNLENDKYSTVSQFKEDMNLIWENAFRFNGKKSYVSLLARQLQIIFKEMTEFLTNNELSDWISELDSLKNEVNAIAKNGSHTTSVQISSVLPPALPTQPSARIQNRQTGHSVESIKQVETSNISDMKTSPKKVSHSQPQQEKSPIASTKPISKKSPKNTSHAILDVDKESRASIRGSHSLYNLPVSKSEPEKAAPPENVKKAPPLNEEEIKKIVDDIQSITDVTIMHKIISLIKKGTPSIYPFENEFDEIQIKVSDIRNSTLVEVQKYLETIKPKEVDEETEAEEIDPNDESQATLDQL